MMQMVLAIILAIRFAEFA